MEGTGLSYRAGHNNDIILHTLCRLAYKACRDPVRAWGPGTGDKGYAGAELQEITSKENKTVLSHGAGLFKVKVVSQLL
jgi:hypothetical protein